MELASRQSRLIVCDANSERINETRRAIEKVGGKVLALTVDVTDSEAVKEMVNDARARHGRVDFIFNNAGTAVAGMARDLTLEDWRSVLEVNLFGVINGINAAYPIMVKQGSGHIINMGSIEGLIPVPTCCRSSGLGPQASALGSKPQTAS